MLGRVSIVVLVLLIWMLLEFWTITILLKLEALKCTGSSLLSFIRVTSDSLVLMHQGAFWQLKQKTIAHILTRSDSGCVYFFHSLVEHDLLLAKV